MSRLNSRLLSHLNSRLLSRLNSNRWSYTAHGSDKASTLKNIRNVPFNRSNKDSLPTCSNRSWIPKKTSKKCGRTCQSVTKLLISSCTSPPALVLACLLCRRQRWLLLRLIVAMHSGSSPSLAICWTMRLTATSQTFFKTWQQYCFSQIHPVPDNTFLCLHSCCVAGSGGSS